jgi:ABC-type nitrate/sulfonate/bicarbonate transport system permease component
MKFINFYKNKFFRKDSRIWGLVLLAIIFGSWEIISRSGLVYQAYFPPLSEIVITLFRLLGEGELSGHILVTFSRMMAGYFIAAFLGVVLGMAMGSWGFVHRLFEPLVELLRPIPSVAIIPIAILFLGIGSVMKIFVIAYASLWPILLNTIDGVRNVRSLQIDTGKVFGLSNREIVARIKLPNALPFIVSGLRVSLAISLILAITTEIIGGSKGLGFFLVISQRSFRVPEMFAGVIVIALLGYGLNRFFLLLESKFLKRF